MLRSFLLIPCLLICLACATPFPFENLEEGMTTESVREKFGEPKAAESDLSGDGRSCWTYWHEEQNWYGTFFPLTPVMTLLTAPVPGTLWDAWYVERNSVFLEFEEGKLVRWEAIGPERAISPATPGRWVTRKATEPERTISPATPYTWSTPIAPDEMLDYEPGSPAVEVGTLNPPPTCTSIRKLPLRGQSEVKSHAIIPTGPQWVFDPSAGRPEPDTSCESERTTGEGRVEAGDTRYVARDNVTLWLEPPASSERRILDSGQRMRILGRRCGWCHVEDDSGSDGWIGCVFLEPTPP